MMENNRNFSRRHVIITGFAMGLDFAIVAVAFIIGNYAIMSGGILYSMSSFTSLVIEIDKRNDNGGIPDSAILHMILVVLITCKVGTLSMFIGIILFIMSI